MSPFSSNVVVSHIGRAFSTEEQLGNVPQVVSSCCLSSAGFLSRIARNGHVRHNMAENSRPHMLVLDRGSVDINGRYESSA